MENVNNEHLRGRGHDGVEGMTFPDQGGGGARAALDEKWIFSLRRRIILVTVIVLLIAVVSITFVLRDRLLEDSKDMTQELAGAIRLSLRNQMLSGQDKAMMQESMEHISNAKSSVLRIMILRLDGTVAFASDKANLGVPMSDVCTHCHVERGVLPTTRTFVLREDGEAVHRNVSLIYNEPPCMGCHPEARVLGKIVIDRSLAATFSLISLVEVILTGIGLTLILLLIPFLTREIDKYIREITMQSKELALLQNMIERLSNTIDRGELVQISAGIIRDVFHADEIDIVIPTVEGRSVLKRWDESTGTIRRRRLEPGEPILTYIDRWLAGDLRTPEVTEDARQVYLPIGKDGENLVLISAHRRDQPLSDVGLKLIDTIVFHWAVSFENARLYYQAITDELTTLFTPRHFRNCICHDFLMAQGRGGRLSMLMMDIDHFKSVNDTYGHPCGDAVLRGVAQCIAQAIRDEDSAFRYGGEEFAALFNDMGAEECRLMAERVRRKVESTVFQTDCGELRVTISIGMATYPDNASDINSLIARADEALYRAKRTGRNRVVVSEVARDEAVCSMQAVDRRQ